VPQEVEAHRQVEEAVVVAATIANPVENKYIFVGLNL
jgi:hypothetical protein